MTANESGELDLVDEIESSERSWTTKDSLFYALAVGAGNEDAAEELQFTTENSHDVPHLALPTLATVLGRDRLPVKGSIDESKVLRAEQGLIVHRPIPTSGRIRATRTSSGIYGTRSGALVTSRTDLWDSESGDLTATLTTGWLIRDAQGSFERRSDRPAWSTPSRPSDDAVLYRTVPAQALLFRLTGDRHPLHSDPVQAKALGLPRPLLHGLCTFGFAARGLLRTVCEERPERFGSMSARFSAPVYPGDDLKVLVWRHDDGAQFQVANGSNEVVVDHGWFRWR